MLIYNEIIKQIIMPLLNFNTKQNIYIQVYIFVQVPCTILSELSKNASSNQSYLFGAFLVCFSQQSINTFQTFTGNDKFPVFAVPFFPSYSTGKEQKTTNKTPTTKATCRNQRHTHISNLQSATHLNRKEAAEQPLHNWFLGDCLCHPWNRSCLKKMNLRTIHSQSLK